MQPNSHKVFVSLTSIPSRIPNLHYTINSLLGQYQMIDKIIVNIPFKYHRFDDPIIIPLFLRLNDKIIINRCEDYGPATKLLGLLANSDIKPEPEDIIIICDDDRNYPLDFVKDLVTSVNKHSNYCITNAGWEIEALSSYRYVKTDYPRGKEYDIEGFIDVLGGCCGFALKYKMVSDKKDMMEVDMNSKIFLVDDVWISGHLTKNGVKIWLQKSVDAPRNINITNALCNLVGENSRQVCNEIAIKYFIDKYHIWENAGNPLTDKGASNKVFTQIYDYNFWGKGSGTGSTPQYNSEYIIVLETIFNLLSIKNIIDIGCGDWQFSQHVNFNGINYLGIDVVDKLIETNNKLFGKTNITFKQMDVLNNAADIGNTDLIILKDILQHWPTKYIVDILSILRSKTKYLLITNCSHQKTAEDDISLGEYRPLSHTLFPLKIFDPLFIRKYHTKEILLVKGNL